MTTQSSAQPKSSFTAAGVGVALLAVGILLNAFALQQLWTWFVVPTFGTAVLTLPAALGLGIVARLFTGFRALSSPIQTFSHPIGGLVFGYLLHLFM